jgi:hypothetical protein
VAARMMFKDGNAMSSPVTGAVEALA